MTRWLTLALALSVLPAMAAESDPPPTPDRYKRPFEGTLVKHSVPYGKAWEKCDEMARWYQGKGYPKMYKRIGDRPLLGCSMGQDRFCIIVWTKGLPNSAEIKEHEIAHCLGWPASHPK